MPIDMKYGRVTLERQRNIGDDEPVVVFRAQDVLLIDILDYYYDRCREAGSPESHLGLIQDAMGVIAKWQQDNHTQVPQSVGYHPKVE